MTEKKNELTSNELNDVNGGWRDYSAADYYDSADFRPYFDEAARHAHGNEFNFIMYLRMCCPQWVMNAETRLSEIFQTYYAHKA